MLDYGFVALALSLHYNEIIGQGLSPQEHDNIVAYWLKIGVAKTIKTSQDYACTMIFFLERINQSQLVPFVCYFNFTSLFFSPREKYNLSDNLHGDWMS